MHLFITSENNCTCAVESVKYSRYRRKGAFVSTSAQEKHSYGPKWSMVTFQLTLLYSCKKAILVSSLCYFLRCGNWNIKHGYSILQRFFVCGAEGNLLCATPSIIFISWSGHIFMYAAPFNGKVACYCYPQSYLRIYVLYTIKECKNF